MNVLVELDPRKIQAMARQLRVSQRELAKRAGVRPDDVSRFFAAVAPGGLMDRLVAALSEASHEEG